MNNNKNNKNNKNQNQIKWYSLKNILAKNADYNLIIGQRSNGKTYALLKYSLEQYKKKGTRFAYIRRWAEDIVSRRAEQLFTPLQAEIENIFGIGYSVRYKRAKYYLVDDQDNEIDVIGHILALNQSAHTKSVAYTNVKTVILDEFIQMSGEKQLADEISMFENTISTIVRTANDVKIFLLANTVSKFSGYFVHFGIDINKVSQGEIVVKEVPLDGDVLRIALEYCEYNPEVGKRTSKYTQSIMIAKGELEINEVDDIPAVVNERTYENLLFSIYDPDANVYMGCYIRHGTWATLEEGKVAYILEPRYHEREFLVIRQIKPDKRSHYYHLSSVKNLSYGTWTDWTMMMKDILENVDIDVERELRMGRVFCDNMFTADFFYHAYIKYLKVSIRDLL